MAVDALGRLERTVLFQALQAREEETKAGHEISERVKAVVAHVAPLLERVPEVMPEFTLHDPNHGAKVVELMAQFLPAETLARLNVVELSILIYAAYLHDLGMTSSREEREGAVRADADYARLLAGDETRSARLQRFKDDGEHRAATAVEDQVYTEYLRRTHVRRSARFIEERLCDIRDEKSGKENALAISWQGTPYSKWVRAVCDSHELPVSRLRDTKTWPRDALVRNLRVNVQYLSLVLRLADILDLDPERTPKVLLDFIDPKDPKSVTEWHKHRSVIGWEITPERIRFEAECTHPVYERALREFLGWIEDERRDSVLLASSYRDDLSKVYRFDLTEPVTAEGVRSNGTYIYSDLKFNIDYQRVLNLLMGERLYGNPVVALRELLQNSVDAVRLRQALIARGGEEPVEPHISVRLDGDTLVIDDNGVGMDEHIVKDYFMQVGRSYYRSAEFRARQLDIDPVSEFGIGILSVFMVADRCEIETRRHPDDPLHPQSSVRIEIPTAYDYFVQRPTDRKHIGTTITLHLKPNHPFKPESLLDTVAEIAPFIDYPITINTTVGAQLYQPRRVGEPVLGENVERVFSVSLEDSDDPQFADVKGCLFIIKDHGTEYYSSFRAWGITAQRGFAIGKLMPQERDSRTIGPAVLNLFPVWTKIEMSIDLRGRAKVWLSPSRGDIVVDEQVKLLRLGIEREVIKSFRTHLKERYESGTLQMYDNYVDELLRHDLMIVRGEISDELRDLMADCITLQYISSDGNLSLCFGRDLRDKELVILTSVDDWPVGISEKDVLSDLKKNLSSDASVLVLKGVADYQRSSIIKGILGAVTGHMVTSIAGLIVTLIERGPEIVSDYNWGSALLTYGLKTCDDRPAPVIIHSSSPADISLITFNASHPLIAAYVNGKTLGDEERELFLSRLSDEIGDIFYELFNSPNVTAKRADGRYVERYSHPNLVMSGILIREPALLDSIRSAFESYWRAAQETGGIEAGMEFPGLTAEDLPWFWSYDGEEG